MIKITVKTILAALVAVAAVAGMTGCSTKPGGNGTPTKSPAPSARPVTIAAPPSADLDKVTVRLTGPVGEQLAVYAFSSGWSKKAPSCTTTSDPVQSVTIGDTGTETIRVSLDHAGVWWWVVASTAHGTTTKCGAVSTVAKTAPSYSFGGPNIPTDSLNGYEGTLPAGKPVKLWVESDIDAPTPLGKGWPVTVKWIGPFSSTPEARAGCRQAKSRTAISRTGTATAEEPGGELSMTPKQPGVYAITASTPESQWNAASDTGCNDDTPLLVVVK